MIASESASKTESVQFFIKTLDRILQNILCTQEVTQKVAMEVIEKIAIRNDCTVCDLLRNLPMLRDTNKRKWSTYIFE